MGANMQGLESWLCMLLAWFPLLIHGFCEWRHLHHPSQDANLRLEVDPIGGWHIKQSGRRLPMSIQWGSRHFFGLTLSLKTSLRSCQHPANRKLTVWRHAVDPQDYRKLCVMYAWFIRQPSWSQSGGVQ